jgi:hypothetical protein
MCSISSCIGCVLIYFSPLYTLAFSMYVHYSSKTLPTTHRPNWNDVRIIRAMLSLLDAALRNKLTTHVLFCTESCIPIVTLKEAVRSILLDEACLWEENGGETSNNNTKEEKGASDGFNWDRSYVDFYDRNSPRCSRFDERESISCILCWLCLDRCGVSSCLQLFSLCFTPQKTTAGVTFENRFLRKQSTKRELLLVT